MFAHMFIRFAGSGGRRRSETVAPGKVRREEARKTARRIEELLSRTAELHRWMAIQQARWAAEDKQRLDEWRKLRWFMKNFPVETDPNTSDDDPMDSSCDDPMEDSSSQGSSSQQRFNACTMSTVVNPDAGKG